MKSARLPVVLCAALAVLAGCSADAADVARPTDDPQYAATRAARPGPTSGSETKVLGNGLVISVSAPTSFTPTSGTAPNAERAIGFEMSVSNEGTASYRPAQLSLLATVDGTSTEQVIDPTQGYPGQIGSADLAPGRTVRFTVAFRVPTGKTALRIVASPDPSGTANVKVFDGTA